MSISRQLYELQEIDLQIDSKSKALEEVYSRIGESEALSRIRALLSEDERMMHELERRQREMEAEAEGIRAKVAAAEGKLYGGTVKNPKELNSMQEQVKGYKKNIEQMEDATLEIMTQIESLRGEMATKREDADRIETEWSEAQSLLVQEVDELRALLAQLAESREALANKIDPARLELYRLLRKKRQGRAVAKVEQGICQGCRITLPMSEMQKVKGGHDIVQCGSCERILYLS